MEGIFSILLIIAAGGAFKEVLVIKWCSRYPYQYGRSMVHILYYWWMLAAIIRVAIGSATVAALLQLVYWHQAWYKMNVSPELMVLSIGKVEVYFFPPQRRRLLDVQRIFFSTYHQRDLSVLDPDGKLYFIDGLGWCGSFICLQHEKDELTQKAIEVLHRATTPDGILVPGRRQWKLSPCFGPGMLLLPA